MSSDDIDGLWDALEVWGDGGRGGEGVVRWRVSKTTSVSTPCPWKMKGQGVEIFGRIEEYIIMDDVGVIVRGCEVF